MLQQHKRQMEIEIEKYEEKLNENLYGLGEQWWAKVFGQILTEYASLSMMNKNIAFFYF